MTVEGEATGAIATTAGKAIEALRGLGGYTAEVFGDAPKDFVGWAVGDRLKARRRDNMQRLGLIAGPMLETVDLARLSEPSPSVMIPLIVAAADEERAELQDLWARLLANAAIDGGRKVRREFFETLGGMEPFDAAVFSLGVQTGGLVRSGGAQEDERTRPRFRALSGYSDMAFDLSVDALIRLRCLTNASSASITRYGMALHSALTIN